MAFTIGNDINILSSADAAIVGAGAGDDLYIISPGNLPSSAQAITVSDNDGNNKLQLIGGLTIASSKVAATALQLVLSNGATINVNGANTFTFEMGGNPLLGTPGVVKTFAEFVTESLGLPNVPTGAEVLNAPSNISVNDDGTTDAPSSGTPLPVGSSTTVEATANADVFTFDVAAARATTNDTQIVLNGFDVQADSLRFDSVISLGDVALSSLNGIDNMAVQSNVITQTTLVTFGPDADGQLVAVTLTGVIDPALVNVSVI